MGQRSRTSPSADRLALVGGVAAIVVAQISFARRTGESLALPLWLGGLAVVIAVATRALPGDARPTPEATASGEDASAWTPRTGWTSARTLVPAGSSAVSALAVWLLQRSRPPEESRWDVVVLWLLSMAFAVVAVWQPASWPSAARSWWGRRRTSWRSGRSDSAFLGAITVLSLGLLLVAPASYPTTLNGDSAAFALLSRRVLDGEIVSPFGVGYLSHPLLWNHVQAAGMWLVGTDVAGARFAGAVGGAAATWFAGSIALRLTGRRATAVTASVLVATSSLQLYWMRSALPNGFTTAWILGVLLLLGVAVDRRSASAMVAAGIAAGVGQYFYFSSRVLVPVVVAVCLLDVAAGRRQLRGPWDAVRSSVRRLVPVGVGFGLAVLPQVAYYTVRPGDFDARTRTISVFRSGWLAAESERTGDHPAVILLRQFVDVAMLPFRGFVPGQYRGDAPYVGWIVALLGAVGLALVTARLLRGALWSGLALTYWTSAAGAATTIEPTHASRAVTLVILTCIFAALGLDLLVRASAALSLVPGRITVPIGAVVVVLAAALGIHRHFHDPDQIEVYADPNTEVVDTLARDLADDPAGTTVYFAGAPRIWYHGFSNFEFRAPQVTGVDIEDPDLFRESPPAVAGPTRFVFLPERGAELDDVEDRYPGGVRTTVLGRDGEVLYEEYRVSGTATAVDSTDG